MTTITLSRNIFVPVKECGSVIIRDTQNKIKIVPGGINEKIGIYAFILVLCNTYLIRCCQTFGENCQ